MSEALVQLSKRTVFISYARADNQKPPYNEAAPGWVTFFWDQLRFELTDRGAKEAILWVDRYEIEPAEAFTPAIEQAVTKAELILPIFSMNWIESDWCLREVETFTETHNDADVRIVPVFKNEPPRERLPSLMQGDTAREGYRFFDEDPRDSPREFYWRGLRDETAYFNRLKKVAEAIIKRLGNAQADRFRAPPRADQKVFLAITTEELKDARQRLVNDLRAVGIGAVPAMDKLPETAAEAEQVIQEALADSVLAVHLLGERRGITLDGSDEPVVALQLRLARAAASTRSLPRILWAPRWLPGQLHTKRDPLEVVGRFGSRQDGEEVFGEEVTDLSQWLRKRLKIATPVSASPSRIIVAGVDGADDELVAQLANRLQRVGAQVEAVFAGDPIPEVVDRAVVIILWSKAGRAAIDALLVLLPANARIICLCLPGDAEIEKRRFFKEGVLLERIELLPSDRQQTCELLQRLEIDAPKEAGL